MTLSFFPFFQAANAIKILMRIVMFSGCFVGEFCNLQNRKLQGFNLIVACFYLFTYVVLVFFFYSIEGPRIHQSGIAAVPGRQFRVRVLHTPHHRLPVHREPEQQLHITSSHSGAPHQQPQRAVVEFQ